MCVELEASKRGRRIGPMMVYENTWKSGCKACMVWRVAEKVEHILIMHDKLGHGWVSKQEMIALRRRANTQGKGWLSVSFSDTEFQYVLTDPSLIDHVSDSVKAAQTLVRTGQLYHIKRVTSSRSWKPPERATRFTHFRTDCETFAEAMEALDAIGCSNGFIRESVTLEQIQWMLREHFDPGIDLT